MTAAMVHTTPAHVLQFDVIPASPMIRLGTMKVQRYSSARVASATLGKPKLEVHTRASGLARAMTVAAIAVSVLLTSAVVTVAVWRDAQEQSARR